MAYVKRCPECGSSNLVYDESRGEVICGDCGLLVEEKPDAHRVAICSRCSGVIEPLPSEQ